MKENNKDAQPKLWADFYYKVVDDVPEFHGNMYLDFVKGQQSSISLFLLYIFESIS